MDDLSALVELENRCFDYDRLSRRNFQWMLTRAHASPTVAEGDGGVLGYALVLFHEGTSLARLYSIAIDPRARGIGLGQKLLEAAEQAAGQRPRLHAPGSAPDNRGAIALYERATATVPSPPCATTTRTIQRSAALRETHPQPRPRTAPPRALLPADHRFHLRPGLPADGHGALQPERQLTCREELRLWREATIYMTAGHGGCSPRAWRCCLAARLPVKLVLSASGPLFLDGVRNEDKKAVMRLVHEDFCEELTLRASSRSARQARHPTPAGPGGQPLVLISSSYRLTRSKAPHLCWSPTTTRTSSTSTIPTSTTAGQHRQPLDCQHIPVSHAEFDKMSRFGRSKLRAAVILFNPE